LQSCSLFLVEFSCEKLIVDSELVVTKLFDLS
jgi:hypothetical protein